MNPHDSTEQRLATAFRARLESAPEPTDAAFARTMATIAAAPPVRSPNLRSASPWWSALAAPARLATAAAIVIVGGTIAFGTVKATRERVSATEGALGPHVSLDRVPERERALARTGSMQVVVPDIASAVRRIGELARRERGEVVSQQRIGVPDRRATRARIVLRIRATQLDATMDAIAALGSVDSRAIQTADLAQALKDVRLRAERNALEERIATATLAIVLRTAESERPALSAAPSPPGEPSRGSLRPTCTLLARGSQFAPPDTELARRRLRPFDRIAPGASATAQDARGTPAGRNDPPSSA